MSEHVRTAIVGAGFAGIGTALRLLEAGQESFVLLERADTVGGTWRDNTYPGVACDVPSHLYCFSFLPNPDFSAVHAPGAEIRDYLSRAVDGSAIGSRLRLSTALIDARWDGELWRLSTSRGELSAQYLVMAAGRMTQPSVPAGVDAFDGPVLHTARWDDAVEVTGRRVVVVGSGASAVQVVPALVRSAAKVTVLVRSAPDVLPRDAHAYSVDERRRFADDPEQLTALRENLRAQLETGYAARVADDGKRAALRRHVLDHLTAQVPDPQLRRRLTPEHEVGCKRVLFSDDFYPALTRATVGSALDQVGADHVVDADGVRHDADVLVLATGFETATQPYARLVHGRGGRSLDEAWAHGMRAFGSTTVAGFPNLVVLDGPNASLSHNSAVLMIESQITWLLGAVAWGESLDVDPTAEDGYVAEVRGRSRSLPWMSGCSNWYVDQRVGEQTLLWPGTAAEYEERFGVFDPAPFERAGWTVVVPLKPFAVGKSRLDVPDRPAVARRLAWDTLAAVMACDLVDEVVVVTDETDLPPQVRVVREQGVGGLNAAIGRGLAAVPVHRHRAVLMGDLPTLTPADLAAVLTAASGQDRAMVTDADGVGTTMLTARGGVELTPQFGPSSAARHCQVAVEIAAARSLRRDVDTAAHLAETALVMPIGD